MYGFRVFVAVLVLQAIGAAAMVYGALGYTQGTLSEEAAYLYFGRGGLLLVGSVSGAMLVSTTVRLVRAWKEVSDDD